MSWRREVKGKICEIYWRCELGRGKTDPAAAVLLQICGLRYETGSQGSELGIYICIQSRCITGIEWSIRSQGVVAGFVVWYKSVNWNRDLRWNDLLEIGLGLGVQRSQQSMCCCIYAPNDWSGP